MKKIPLTQGKFAFVDDEDFERVNQYRWHIITDGNKKLYAASNIKGERVLMHRFLINIPKGFETDHKNGNSLDNRKENLRKATHGQNIHNSKLRKDNTSGFKGVRKQGNKYIARIQINNKQIHLGYFDTALQAAQAYKSASLKYFGKFYNEPFSSD